MLVLLQIGDTLQDLLPILITHSSSRHRILHREPFHDLLPSTCYFLSNFITEIGLILRLIATLLVFQKEFIIEQRLLVLSLLFAGVKLSILGNGSHLAICTAHCIDQRSVNALPMDFVFLLDAQKIFM